MMMIKVLTYTIASQQNWAQLQIYRLTSLSPLYMAARLLQENSRKKMDKKKINNSRKLDQHSFLSITQGFKYPLMLLLAGVANAACFLVVIPRWHWQKKGINQEQENAILFRSIRVIFTVYSRNEIKSYPRRLDGAGNLNERPLE